MPRGQVRWIDSGVFLRPMKLTLVGSRYFGATVFQALVKEGLAW